MEAQSLPRRGLADWERALAQGKLQCTQCGYFESEPIPVLGARTISKTGSEHSPRFEYRPWQSKVIERIVKSIKEGKRVSLDAPTGSGKTLIALAVIRNLLSEDSPAFKQAFIAVRTINELICTSSNN